MKYRKLLAVLLIGNLAIGMTGCGGAGNIDATSVSAATTTQKDILDMLNTSDTITIEMSVEDTNEGYKYTVEWIRLGDMTSSKDVRSTVDELFKITGSTGNKNGCFYTNEKGENTQNGTLALSMRNRAVTSILKDTEELNMNLATKYSDLEVGDANAVYTAIADYFELLPCDESGESKSDDALSRAEAMSMVFKAMNPVDDSISEDAGFNSAVGENSLNIFAAQEEGNCFINTSDGSLNSTTYTQHMTKAEFVYMVMNSVFGEAEVQKISGDFHLDGMDNAGNLKADEKISGKAQAGSAIIKEFITNPTSIDENIYKSIVLADSQKIISSTDDLDNAITKADAVKILCNALMLNPNIDEFNFSNGTSDDIIEGTGVTLPVEGNGDGLSDNSGSEDELNRIADEEEQANEQDTTTNDDEQDTDSKDSKDTTKADSKKDSTSSNNNSSSSNGIDNSNSGKNSSGGSSSNSGGDTKKDSNKDKNEGNGDKKDTTNNTKKDKDSGSKKDKNKDKNKDSGSKKDKNNSSNGVPDPSDLLDDYIDEGDTAPEGDYSDGGYGGAWDIE